MTATSVFGPVMSGEGSVAHHGNGNVSVYQYIGGELARRKDVRIVEGDLTWLYQRFVEPGGYAQAQEVLDEHGIVVLSGLQGSGLTTAAKMLLRAAGSGVGQLCVIDPDEAEGMLDRAHEIQEGDRYLLDLSASTEHGFAEALRAVPALRGLIQAQLGRLVVVLPKQNGHWAGAEFAQWLVEVERPSGARVLQRHLRAGGIRCRIDEIAAPVVEAHVLEWPLRELVEFARLAREERASGAGGGLAAWLGAAAVAMGDRTAEIAEQLRKNDDERQRALLITAALFNNAPLDSTAVAWKELLVAERSFDERPSLAQPDLLARFADFDKVELREGKVAFHVAYDEAVREYFWMYYPELRPTLRDWLIHTAVGEARLRTADREAVAGRFADLSLKFGNFEDVMQAVEAWTERAEVWALPCAAVVLERGLRHPVAGQFFRRRLYAWATDDDLSPERTQLAVRMCADVMVALHPDQALVRLHQLARRGGSRKPWARNTLCAMVREDFRLFPRWLDRLVAVLEEKHHRLDDDLFLDVVGPVFTAFPGKRWGPGYRRRMLVRGWRQVMRRRPRGDWAAAVRLWLEQCTPGDSTPLDVLVEAGDGDAEHLGGLFLIACAWARGPGVVAGRGEVLTLLLRKINIAQGIPADFEELS